ncbi:hypothetical protein BS78_05G189100 [Paspalum vaginatum]|nr:hypothetical protein BS78_05G189100 [Paspalum vaginatum]
MRVLDIPNLLRAGCVCTSWYAAYSVVRCVRIPITDAAPCLLYSRAANDADTATLHSPSGGVDFKVRVPAPMFRSRYVIGSGHGWVVAADEASNLHTFNPLTGAQLDLPPVTGLYHVETSSDDQGRLLYNLYDDELGPDTPSVYTPRELRMLLYYHVHLSCSPSAGAECVILLEHRPVSEHSYAALAMRDGLRSRRTRPYRGMVDGSIHAFDLSGPSPTATTIIQKDALWNYPTSSYIVFAPWGDMLLVSRHTEARTLTRPLQVPVEHAHDVIDPCIESYTYEMQLHKVDIDDRKLVEVRSSDLRGHALFLGFNSAIFLSTKDFPSLRPNCAYLMDDNSEMIILNMYGCRDVGIWNFETKTLESLADVHSVPPWLAWPPPIWITPSLS